MTNRNHTSGPTDASSCVVVMAKNPVPGRVKTRLSPEYSPYQAACIHAAMLDCVLNRLMKYLPGRHLLALDDQIAPTGPLSQDYDSGLAYQIPAGF
jgi:glycosyltransferase A (GT-A) superfamily protein (DUF2064 family)